MKKFVVASTVALTIAGTVTSAAIATTQIDASAKGKKTLKVGFVPSVQSETMEARTKPLAKMLEKELGRPVKIVVSTDYNSIVESLGSGKLDIGFLPPDAYVQAHKQYKAKLLLESQRFGVNKEDGTPTGKKVSWYKSEVIVKKDSDIKSIKDLKGKNIAVQDVSSSSGYIFPAWYLNSKGINVTKKANLQTVKGHDQGVLALANGQVDAAFVFQDARNLVKKDIPSIFEDTKVLTLTDKIPSDTVTARKGLSKSETDKISKALIKIAKTDKGHKIVKDIYSIEGFAKGKDKDFDIVRKASKFIEKN